MDFLRKEYSIAGLLDHAADFTSGLITHMICILESEVLSNQRHRRGAQPVSNSLPWGIRIKTSTSGPNVCVLAGMQSKGTHVRINAHLPGVSCICIAWILKRIPESLAVVF